ncbi:YcaO-like family protein [Companilactobacillus huachuanensis]|uniref:YcaO-like family protein n=1 Tax=Companilactobacillus huachuanensis TaxID=2559914 RepID=A0ABW1RIE6_9LACO|nr:YcaO-like family protein [Companilactobacillus huachuanensis]
MNTKFGNTHSSRFGVFINHGLKLPEIGDPQFYIYGGNLGDLSQIDSQEKHNWGDPMKLGGAGGDAIDENKAKNKAFVETMERYCNAFWDTRQLITGSYEELSKEYSIVDILLLPICSKGEYERNGLSKMNSHIRMSWIKVIDIFEKKEILLPLTYVYPGGSKNKKNP